MKLKGFSADSYVTRSLRRGRRVLAAAGLFALVVGFWPRPAQAAIKCNVHIFHSCSQYVCCFQVCTICYDTLTGDIIDISCGDTICYERYP